MTDRELLEKAAKAVGLRISNYLSTGGLSVCSDTRRSPHNWNPLTDDGDALRLAVKLELHIGKSAIAPSRYAARHDLELPGNGFYEQEGTDPYAATRRAIVRAAAAIGEKE